MACSHQVSSFSIVWRTRLLHWNTRWIANWRRNTACNSGPKLGALCCDGGGSVYHPSTQGWRWAGVLGWEQQQFNIQSQVVIPWSKKVTNHVICKILKVYADVASPILLLPRHAVCFWIKKSTIQSKGFAKWRGYRTLYISALAVAYEGSSWSLNPCKDFSICKHKTKRNKQTKKQAHQFSVGCWNIII